MCELQGFQPDGGGLGSPGLERCSLKIWASQAVVRAGAIGDRHWLDATCHHELLESRERSIPAQWLLARHYPGLKLTNDRNQSLGSNERRLAIGCASPSAVSRFVHSKARQHANDAGVVPATTTLCRHFPPVQFIRYRVARGKAGRSQFANRQSEGRRNRLPLLQH